MPLPADLPACVPDSLKHLRDLANEQIRSTSHTHLDCSAIENVTQSQANKVGMKSSQLAFMDLPTEVLQNIVRLVYLIEPLNLKHKGLNRVKPMLEWKSQDYDLTDIYRTRDEHSDINTDEESDEHSDKDSEENSDEDYDTDSEEESDEDAGPQPTTTADPPNGLRSLAVVNRELHGLCVPFLWKVCTSYYQASRSVTCQLTFVAMFYSIVIFFRPW